MKHDFYLAAQYLLHYRGRTLILLICASMIGILPLLLRHVLTQAEQVMLARAEATPWLIGARGSTADTTLAALYFRDSAPAIHYAEIERVERTGWALAMPIHARYRIHQQPLLGITPDYFEFRHLVPAAGNLPGFIGDCILGARAAAALGLKTGDTLVSNPDNFFDLAGLVPLKLHITGVLAATGTADDEAIYVDMKTIWIMEGLGHGHESSAPRSDTPGSPFSGLGQPALQPTTETAVEITQDNIDSFHFHGDMNQYPVTAVIVVPENARAATLLSGRYVDETDTVQLTRPVDVIRHLLDSIFRIGALFTVVLLGVSGAALLALVLVFALSLQLRRGELDTMDWLGCDRFTVVRLITAEILLIVLCATGLGAALMSVVQHQSGPFTRMLLDTL